jgi:predicted PurR-regulated permease PerM
MPLKNEERSVFVEKIWIATGIVAFSLLMVWLFLEAFQIVLLSLAGALIALYFHGLAGIVQRKMGLSERVSLLLSVTVTLLFISLLLWLIGAQVQEQINQIVEDFPEMLENAKNYLAGSQLGRSVLNQLDSEKMSANVSGFASEFFRSGFGVLGDLYVVFFVSLFFTASPSLYRKGIITLVPKNGRERANQIMMELSGNLRKWLKGKLLSMAVVFVLTAIGLAALSVPAWLALALLAGLLSFIPNFGPLLSLLPALLVGLMQSPLLAGMIAGLYVLIQAVESNLITPVIQQKLVEVPPALILLVQIVMGILAGGWGVLLATPVLVIVMILVKQLYLKQNQ